MIISISGVPGSGKTSVAKILAGQLGMKFYSMGDLRGKMAMERGITIDELNKIGEEDKTTDTSVDDYQKKLGQQEDHFIVEGRLSWHFIPHSFKIFLDCAPMVAAQRIYAAKRASPGKTRADEAAYASVEEAKAALDARIASDAVRYKKHYGIDYRDPSHYDFALDTTGLVSAQETADRLLAELKRRGKVPS